jgi:hypothetical protein
MRRAVAVGGRILVTLQYLASGMSRIFILIGLCFFKCIYIKWTVREALKKYEKVAHYCFPAFMMQEFPATACSIYFVFHHEPLDE